jgi:formate dehydrogenase subunit delta
MDRERLVAMANQIAAFFKAYPEAEAVKATQEHIRLYWDPRMRGAFADHLAETGGAGLDPIALSAARALNPPASPGGT